jgi:septal ring-binding cell division protein DamX
MKALNILLLVLVFLSVGCKTQKIAPMPEAATRTAKTQTTQASGASVSSKEESVTAAKGEASDFGSKHFYVILGSFSIYDNAQKFKKQLMGQDFYPGILVNQNGLYRVSVNSYDDETQARSRIREIRQKFPQYSDLWLLIKK